ncbi:MAG TPA: alanyl-tRNA editing protein [Anaeromyxobacter sp.]|nr:alanyl-tRNA editing protein [Anaeromyxobacter sp.]
MTLRLDQSDPDLLRFEAEVVEVRSLAGKPAVVLDRTAFYPEGGGQPADRGLLSGVRVTDVQEVDGVVLHALDGQPPSGRVLCQVDPARRRDHLQQHHGQHLLSAAFARVCGAATVSFHLGEERCTIDLDRPPSLVDDAALRSAEAAANDLVFRDLPVTAREFTPDEIARLPLRKEPARGARVVVVSTSPLGEPLDPSAIVDASPCGGTHPRRTGAVGMVAVLRAQRWGSGTRVEFICGGRVASALDEANRWLREAAAALRCAPAELPAAAVRVAAEATARRKDLDGLLSAAALGEADRLAASAPGLVRAVLVPPAQGAAAWIRAVAQGLAARGRVALLGASEGGRAYLAFARPRGEGPDLGAALRRAAGALGGKGGGAPDLAQGSGTEVSRLAEILAEAERSL